MKKPILIVIAGPNGSGKTSITNKILQHEWVDNCLYINPDNIANDTFGDWNSNDAVMKAAIYSSELRESCLNDGKSLIFETVLSTNEKINFINRAKSIGYFVRLFFVGTESPTINASRITQRVMEGGHDVPITKIISRYSKSIANSCLVSKLVDRAYFYYNSIDFEEPKLLFRVSNGRIIKKYSNETLWSKPVINFLEQ
jgi:predicted ABC-type ATPase